MTVKVNVQERTLDREMTVAEFVEQEQYTITRIAVEINGEIVPKATYSQVIVHNGDVIEVVSFVGGG